MAATPSVKVVKTSSYKNGLRLWSNRHHFLGGTPADATHWHTLMDAIVAVEKTAVTSETTITECVGYAAGSDVPVASKVYSTVGTLTWVSGNAAQALETCALIRYATAAKTTKNHPIYLFTYWHQVAVLTAGVHFETLDANQKSALATYAGDWISGFSDGTNTYTRAGPYGQAATGAIVEEYVTHRDFPYSTSV
jgi:hypothetical protein